MQINFYPESDNSPDYESAAREYAKIWKDNGDLFVNSLERESGLKFKTKQINAVIHSGYSYSIPLMLRYSYEPDTKKAVLMHELSHRLLVDNNFAKLNTKDVVNFTEELHKLIFLFLYSSWVDVLGQEVADKIRDEDISKGNVPYVNAWNWVMSFSKAERQAELEKMKQKYQV